MGGGINSIWDEWVRLFGYADWEEGEYQDFYYMMSWGEPYPHRERHLGRWQDRMLLGD